MEDTKQVPKLTEVEQRKQVMLKELNDHWGEQWYHNIPLGLRPWQSNDPRGLPWPLLEKFARTSTKVSLDVAIRGWKDTIMTRTRDEPLYRESWIEAGRPETRKGWLLPRDLDALMVTLIDGASSYDNAEPRNETTGSGEPPKRPRPVTPSETRNTTPPRADEPFKRRRVTMVKTESDIDAPYPSSSVPSHVEADQHSTSPTYDLPHEPVQESLALERRSYGRAPSPVAATPSAPSAPTSTTISTTISTTMSSTSPSRVLSLSERMAIMEKNFGDVFEEVRSLREEVAKLRALVG